METAKELLSPRAITGFPEQRLSFLSADIERVRAQYCVVLEPASLVPSGIVRFGDVAAHPGLATRILADLMQPPPIHQLKEDDPAEAAAGVFETFGPQEITVVSSSSEYVGLITPESVAGWLLENERRRKLELEHLLSEQRRLVDFMEKKVSARLKEIGAALDRLGEVSLTLSHDIRGPLNSIRGFADLLVRGEGGELNPDGQTAAHRIQRAATNVQTMANAVLDDARRLIEQEPRPFAAVDLNEVLADAIEFLDAQIRESGAHVTSLGKLHVIEGYYVPILQIFINLIGNALKYVSSGQNPVIEIWTEDKPEGVVLSIKDNGIGIKPEIRDQLPQPFRSRAQPNIPGSGLGLTITRNAISALGGRMNLESENGKGTVFTLTLRHRLAEGNTPPAATPDVAPSN